MNHTLYAYRHKQSGEYASFQPYWAKAPATSALHDVILSKLRIRTPVRRLTPEDKFKVSLAKQDYELVSFKLVREAELEWLNEQAAKYEALCK
jgi:hypothetical protein